MANIPQGFTRLAGSERSLPMHARRVRPVDPQLPVTLSVYLRDPAPPSLAGTLQMYARHPGQQVSRAEYLARHSAHPRDIQKVERFARRHHLAVSEVDRAARRIVLSGTLGNMMAAFLTDLHHYEHQGRTFRGRAGYLHIPNELAALIEGVFGLDDRQQARAQIRYGRIEPAAGPRPTGYTPLQLARLYNFPGGLDGSGQCVALIELGGGYHAGDLATYFGQLGVPMPHVVSVSVDGAQNSPGDPNGADGEVALDIEVIGALAPGARIAVYFAPNTDRGFLDAITRAIHDSSNNPTVISISWGSAETHWTSQSISTMDQAFQAAASLGITICAAAGDNGSSDGVDDQQAHVDFPASSPYILGCGGTRLDASGGRVTDEIVWNEAATGDGATGGGISALFPLPPWQEGVPIPPSVNDQRRGRGVPDVAGDADPRTGYQVYFDGQSVPVGGTSAVAPLWAGLIALLNQKLGRSVGYMNPFLYQHSVQLTHSRALRDVTSGSNGAYTAGPGWDACSGLGTPDGALFLQALLSPPS
jgi:kumamolisin